MLFFAHLALEKIPKAHVCLHTQDLAPRIHNLVRLAEMAEVELSAQQVDILAVTYSFSLKGRYPDMSLAIPSIEEASGYMKHAEEIFTWLKNRLP